MALIEASMFRGAEAWGGATTAGLTLSAIFVQCPKSLACQARNGALVRLYPSCRDMHGFQ